MTPADHAAAFSLAGHRALITGGGSGLGFGIARCFVAAGAAVVLAGRDPGRLDEAVARLGPQASAAPFDVADTEAASGFAARLQEQARPISILVNNAGGTVKKPVADMDVEAFRDVLDVHVVGSFALTRALLPQLRAGGQGSVLFTASTSSFLGVVFGIFEWMCSWIIPNR